MSDYTGPQYQSSESAMGAVQAKQNRGFLFQAAEKGLGIIG
jgi:hypothetical protein